MVFWFLLFTLRAQVLHTCWRTYKLLLQSPGHHRFHKSGRRFLRCLWRCLWRRFLRRSEESERSDRFDLKLLYVSWCEHRCEPLGRLRKLVQFSQSTVWSQRRGHPFSGAACEKQLVRSSFEAIRSSNIPRKSDDLSAIRLSKLFKQFIFRRKFIMQLSSDRFIIEIIIMNLSARESIARLRGAWQFGGVTAILQLEFLSVNSSILIYTGDSSDESHHQELRSLTLDPKL